MKAFIDTSSLVKKYIEEDGSNKLDKCLEEITELIISPITSLEINSVLERKLREKTITKAESVIVEKEYRKDLIYMGVVNWNSNLENKSIELIRKHQLKVFDGLQLASGVLSKSNLFITSDEKLFIKAKKEIKCVFI